MLLRREEWIGLTDLATKGVYRWTSGQTISWETWADQQPDNLEQVLTHDDDDDDDDDGDGDGDGDGDDDDDGDETGSYDEGEVIGEGN